jgi:copper homeostasis protein
MRSGSSRILLEVTLTSATDAAAAARAGADRIELCDALQLDGLTPSLGTLRETLAVVSIPVVALVRPRTGDFVYTPDEMRTMQRDIGELLAHGAAAVALGVLTIDGRIDEPACRELLAACGGRPAVFHRAFDGLVDPLAGLDVLIELGFARVLTSGGPATIVPPSTGAGVVRELRERAAGRIEILPAGGIRAENVRSVIEATGCDQVHSSCRRGGGRFDAGEVAALRGAVDGG